MVTTDRPPIRIVTRLLAELQTSIISAGIHLTDGDVDRFAILSLIVRLTALDRSARDISPRVPIMSLAGSLSKPYETVRRHAQRLVAAGLCERGPRGIGLSRDPAGRAALDAVLVHAHDAFVRFVDDLRRLAIPLPQTRAGGYHGLSAGLEAAVDIMLAVLDGNRAAHADWTQLVVFSAIFSANVDRFARDPAVALSLTDETQPMPPGLMRPISVAALTRLLGLPETSLRRQVGRMVADGRLARERSGLVVAEAWLNRPDSVMVSRQSVNNTRRVLERLAARFFPFDAPASAYITGRPADVATASSRDGRASSRHG